MSRHDTKTATVAALALVCPADGARLRRGDESHFLCSDCGQRYPIDEGVLRLLGEDDAFYEGAYHNHVAFAPRGEAPWHVWPLWLINSGYPWLVRRHVTAGSLVVELGCAGGVRYFGQRYRMIGCDLSGASLTSLAGVYSALVQVDATRSIPLADDSADAIVSSSFWEHVPPARKAKLASECARVLRPGGKLIFLYDVETDNPLIRRYKRDQPELYHREFREADGHAGYQTPDQNQRLFRAAGLSVIEHRGLEKTPLMPGSVYTKLARSSIPTPRCCARSTRSSPPGCRKAGPESPSSSVKRRRDARPVRATAAPRAIRYQSVLASAPRRNGCSAA